MSTPICALFSQAEVARMANLPPPQFVRLVQDGKITPDFKQGKTLLFQPATVEKIKKDFGR
jgi:hypothetical protein